jgi:putative oxidoreductase
MKIGHHFSKYSEEAYSLLRIMAGFLFSFHGAQKILGLLTEPSMMPPVGSELWFGGIIELVCGLMILAGFLTPVAAFLASGQMAVAYFQFHWKFASDNNFFPIINHGELAVIYCFLFLFIATKGGGKWSVDSSTRGRTWN